MFVNQGIKIMDFVLVDFIKLPYIDLYSGWEHLLVNGEMHINKKEY
jgi:hypothetical protein